MRFTEIFSGISEPEKEAILAFAEKWQANKNEQIYRKGYIGIIIGGCAAVVRTGIGGGSIAVRNIGAGEVFGAASLFGEWDTNFSSITAKTKTEVLYISEENLRVIFTKYPAFAVNYIKFLTDRIRFLNRRLDTYCAGGTVNKLYEFLLSNADQNGEAQFSNISELAKRLKIGRTSLYRDISALENSGLLKRNKNIFIIKKGD